MKKYIVISFKLEESGLVKPQNIDLATCSDKEQALELIQKKQRAYPNLYHQIYTANTAKEVLKKIPIY